MYIDTVTANSRSSRPQVIISPSPYNDSLEPEMDAFVGQSSDVPPPTYLEATTPGLYTSRLSGEEGARLLSFDGREARDVTYKEEQYARRTFRSQCCLKRNWIKSLGLLLGIMMLSAMVALMLVAMAVRSDKHVRSQFRF